MLCELCSLNKEGDTIIAVRKQRAYVRGYMTLDMANFVYDKLQADPYLFIRTSNNNSIIDDTIKVGSVIFNNGLPVITNPEDYNNEEHQENIPDADWSFNFGLPLHRPFDIIYGKKYPQINSTDIVEIDIGDLRWNDNTHLWGVLLSTLHLYHK